MSKSALIGVVQAQGRFYDAEATQSALALARTPGNEELQAKAHRLIGMADALSSAANEIIARIHDYWPREGAE